MSVFFDARGAVAEAVAGFASVAAASAQVVEATVPTIAREKLTGCLVVVAFGGGEFARQSRGRAVALPAIDVGVLGPLEGSPEEMEELAADYMRALEAIGYELLEARLDEWHVVGIETLTPVDAERWRGANQFAGVLRVTMERRA